MKIDINTGDLKYYCLEPIISIFDYLIIDECSKTTFQEFLVPALYAKKWILVGDVMQLSPFIEKEQILTNIEQMKINGKTVPLYLQQAVFIYISLRNVLLVKIINLFYL